MLVTPFVTLTYKNQADQEMSLAPFSTFWVTKCEESLKNQVHSQKQVGTHGKFVTGASLDERYITLSGEVMHGLNISLAKRSLNTVFNPTLTGVLHFKNTDLNIERDIDCYITELPKVYWSNKRLRFDINLVCHDPFWRGTSVVQHIAETVKKFKFILKIPSTGMSFGLRRRTLSSQFDNIGNVESGFIAVLRAKTGTVVNPEIRKETTDEKIKLLYTMQKGDVITITSMLQEKRIDINGINGFKYIDAENTSFFKLDVNTNIIGYYAEENVSNLHVYLRYTPNYTDAEV